MQDSGISIMGMVLCQELTKAPAMLMNETNYKTDYGWTVFIGGH
jgi:hypothetical protein